jgi:CRISPR/Cas system Type II protein with McrA/HNH and RuvC-like nuclease domain
MEYMKNKGQIIYSKQKGCCNRCNVHLKQTNIEKLYDLDYIIPLSILKSNDISNLQYLCIECYEIKTNEDKMKIIRLKKKAKKFGQKFKICYICESICSSDNHKCLGVI